jgi:succinate dehydrogenase / fumarate reductase membrane anchor subunit
MSAPSSTKSIRTPLARARGRGSSHSGTNNFWVQRITSVLLIPLTVAFVILVLMSLTKDHAGAVQLLGSPCGAIIMLLFALVGIYHMWIGLQEIITDYVHDGLMILALMGNTLFCLVLGFASSFAVLKLAFGM